MSYASLAALIERFGEGELIARTDRTGSGVIEAAAVARALDDADAEIDAHLAARYALPLPAVPPLLARVACDIARYRLWQDDASEEVRRRYEDARRLLEAVAAGKVSLGLPVGDRPRPSLAAARSGQPPAFARDHTGSF